MRAADVAACLRRSSLLGHFSLIEDLCLLRAEGAQAMRDRLLQLCPAGLVGSSLSEVVRSG